MASSSVVPASASFAQHIDAFTIGMGRLICSNFALDQATPMRLTEAIQKLKKYSSYGNVIWFGFGIKHIVTYLAETKEGLVCVGLCASLSTVYDNMDSAQVLRELCLLCETSDNYTPALQQ